MPKLKSKIVRIDNSINATYVLLKYYNNTYVYSTYQKNMSTGCYYITSVQKGYCAT
jgi:hypothetical protein